MPILFQCALPWIDGHHYLILSACNGFLASLATNEGAHLKALIGFARHARLSVPGRGMFDSRDSATQFGHSSVAGNEGCISKRSLSATCRNRTLWFVNQHNCSHAGDGILTSEIISLKEMLSPRDRETFTTQQASVS